MLTFSDLLPDLICDVAAHQGYKPTGQIFAHASYENRVYEIGLENEKPIVAKFYRPGRWSVEGLIDEHQFLERLIEAELAVIEPIKLKHPIKESATLGQIENMHYAFSPKFGGHHTSELNSEQRHWLGRSLARLHNVGEKFSPRDRLDINPQTYGYDNINMILNRKELPDDLVDTLEATIVTCVELTEIYFKAPHQKITLHGDLHHGNILWNTQGLFLTDFDDMVTGPPIQDVWMLFSGTSDEIKIQQQEFLEGYQMFRDFNEHEFRMTEALRTLRMIKHAAWIGERFHEPLFERTFSYFATRKYWENLLLNLKEQAGLLQTLP